MENRCTPVVMIAKRELRSLLASPLGYLVLFCFSILLWYLYHGAVQKLTNMPARSPYSLAPLSAFFDSLTLSVALLFIVPAITMRAIAEEKLTGTYELLLTYPVEPYHIILGKFLGVWAYYALLWLPSLFQIFLISYIGTIDWGQVLVVYVYLFFCGGAFLAIGIMVSCLFSSQLAAFMITFTLLLPFHSHIFWQDAGRPEGFEAILRIDAHLERACRGTMDSSTIFLLSSLAIFFLYVAVQVVEARKWLPLPLNLLDWAKSRLTVFVLAFVWISSIAVLVSNQTIVWKTACIGIAISGVCVRIVAWMYREHHKSILTLGANAIWGSCSALVIVVISNYLSWLYNARLDGSLSKAFTMDSSAIQVVQKELPPGEQIHAIALVGYTDRHSHEHTERDNERYFLLQEAFRKMADSLNRPGERRFQYEFVQPAADNAKVSDYVKQDKARKDRIAMLQNLYGISGYREVVLVYRNRYHVILDSQLFEKRLERSQVPRLLVLWRKIYETGGMIEPPPADEEEAFSRLQKMANPEMLSVFPSPKMEEVLVNACLYVIRGTPRNIYFTQGQGEKAISGGVANDHRSAYRLAGILKRTNFNVHPLRLDEVKTIPLDCDVLVILGMDRHASFSGNKLEMIEQYLSQGGKLLVFLPADVDGGLSPLWEKYGIETKPSMAVRYFFSGTTTKVKKTETIGVETICNEDHPLAKWIDQRQEEENSEATPFYMTRARWVEVSSKPPENISFLRLLEVSPRVIAETVSDDLAESGILESGNSPDPGNKAESRKNTISRTDRFSLGVIATQAARQNGQAARQNGQADNNLTDKNKRCQICVVGNVSFAGDAPFYESGMESPIPYILLGSNRFLLPALLAYMAKPLPILPVSSTVPMRFECRFLTPFQCDAYFYANGIVCFFLLILGICIALREARS